MTIVTKNSLTLSNVNDGTITHTAWSKSMDGTYGFTTVYPNLNLLEDGKFAKPISPKWNTDGTTILKDNITGYFKVIFNGTGYYNRAYYTASISTIPIGGKYSVYIKAYSLEDSLNIKLGSVNTSQAVTVTKNGNVPKIYKVDGLVRGTSDTFGIFGGLTTTVGTLFVSEIKVEPGSIATPYMQSASEVTTADWPKYKGEYSNLSSEQSTNPSDYTWGPMRGDDGVGIKTTVITYAISTSGTTAPTTGWTGSVPTLVKGQYLWTKTVWTYTDNSSETGYSVSYISKDGTNGTNGTSGIIVSSVAPDSPQTGQLWQDTSTTPQLIKKWTGNEWVIWELYAQNLKADKLETLTAIIGKIYNEFDNSSGGIDNKGRITIEDSVKVVYYLGNSSTTIDLVTSSSGQGLFTQYLPDKTDASKFQQSWYMPTGLYFTDSINNWTGQITAENVTLVPWTNLTYLSGYTTAENNPCQYRKIKNLDGSYIVQFRGQVKPVSGSFSINTQYNPIRVPVDAQPATNKFGLGIGDFAGAQSARLVSFVNDGANKGTIQVLVTGTASSYIAIDNLTYIL